MPKRKRTADCFPPDITEVDERSASFFCEVRSSAAAAACFCEDSAQFVRSGPFHRFLRPPLTRNLSPADPFPTPSMALGTRNRLLRYGICVPCSKRLPGVRDAFSEALGVKNRRFWYRREIRCAKTAFSGTRRIFKGPQNSRLHRLWIASCRTGRIFSV